MMIKTKMMKMAQVLMLLLLVAFLFITLHLSSSLRHTSIYFIINLLIIALGADAGLLKAFSNPLDQDKKPFTTPHVAVLAPKPASSEHSSDHGTTHVMTHSINENKIKVVKMVEKSKSEKIAGAVKMDIKAVVKKCPSMPSLFFIGGGDGDEAEDQVGAEEEEEVVGGDLSGQELYTKAEMFIGNFYKQLKMQREDSWKRIHGFYQRAF